MCWASCSHLPLLQRIFVSLTDRAFGTQEAFGTPNSTPFQAYTTRYALMPSQVHLLTFSLQKPVFTAVLVCNVGMYRCCRLQRSCGPTKHLIGTKPRTIVKTCDKLVAQAFSHASRLLPSAVLRCCLLYTSPSPRDQRGSRMPSSA